MAHDQINFNFKHLSETPAFQIGREHWDPLYDQRLPEWLMIRDSINKYLHVKQ